MYHVSSQASWAVLTWPWSWKSEALNWRFVPALSAYMADMNEATIFHMSSPPPQRFTASLTAARETERDRRWQSGLWPKVLFAAVVHPILAIGEGQRNDEFNHE